MYSMVNLAALVRDVARHPRAAALADDLLRVLALDEAALADLERVRWNALAQATRRVEVAEVTDALPSWSRGDVETTNNGTLAVEVLERTPMSTAGDLTRFVRRELLAFAWRSYGELAVSDWPRAIDVVADGIAATYALPYAGRAAERLGRPWRVWVRMREAPLATTPYRTLLAGIRTLRAERLATMPRIVGWAEAMHDACWAVQLTGRERLAATTQLAALRALLAVTNPLTPPAAAVAGVTAAAQATVVADLLPTERVELLMSALAGDN